MARVLARIAASAALLAAVHAHAASSRLESYGADLTQTSVSGLSSGGYMAVQFDVAFSSISRGVGIIAAGPYLCAEGNAYRATMVCSCPFFVCTPGAGLDVKALVQHTEELAASRAIAPTSNLKSHRVWLFSGTQDSIVPPRVVDAAARFYRHYEAPLLVYPKREAQHGMPTRTYGVPCSVAHDPYLMKCGVDAARELLTWIYGPLSPAASGKLAGAVVAFDQAAFIDDAAAHGMSETGYVFVPSSCRTQTGCRIHIALHGCRQYPSETFFDIEGNLRIFGKTFVKHAGYIETAETNRIIVLFPQTAPTARNPEGCWDWWGYDDADYAVKSGRQLAAIRRMIGRIAGE
jgi:poly(3-hydroxybutyrate) depolymerase